MRKGEIFILTKDIKETYKLFDYLCENLKNKKAHCKPLGYISVNRYNIKIQSYWERAYRPEISYVFSLTHLDESMYKDMVMKTKMYSERKKPVRVIDDFQDIDLREIQDDEYALENTIKINNIRGKRASMMIVDEASDNLK